MSRMYTEEELKAAIEAALNSARDEQLRRVADEVMEQMRRQAMRDEQQRLYAQQQAQQRAYGEFTSGGGTFSFNFQQGGYAPPNYGQSYAQQQPRIDPRIRDAFAYLGIPANATKEQINQRYRELARQHHPDAGGESERRERTERMKRINAAYDVLKGHLK